MSKNSKSKNKFQVPKGMRDILPEEQLCWEKTKRIISDSAKAFEFERIDTPILEEKDLFVKGTGIYTDIVEKEMYNLTTKGKDKLVLRPEFTPSIIRAYLENGLSSLPHPVKLYSIGPIFRYERPQKGRYRQAHQANFEVIGEDDPVLDAQLIQLFFFISKKLGLKKLITQINSIGCSDCRPNYRKKLINYYRSNKKNLCSDCQKRLKQNPLRLLDCKNIKCIAIAEEAPQSIDCLCDNCRSHFKGVLEYLDELEIPYALNSRLVRGLDYYTKTVFEVWPEEEDGRQISLCGGGRYNKLVKLLGGKDIPAVGFAIGLDRIINLIGGNKKNLKSFPSIFLVQLGDIGKKKSLKLFEELQQAGLRTASSFSKNTIKAQLKIANKMNVRFALILGQKEAIDESIILRDMTSGSQEVIPLNKVIKELKKRIKK